MMLANLLFLFRKIKEVCGVDYDQVHAPNMACPLQYSTIRANSRTKKRSEKVHFLLDNRVTPCYNGYITIRNHEKSNMTY